MIRAGEGIPVFYNNVRLIGSRLPASSRLYRLLQEYCSSRSFAPGRKLGRPDSLSSSHGDIPIQTPCHRVYPITPEHLPLDTSILIPESACDAAFPIPFVDLLRSLVAFHGTRIAVRRVTPRNIA
jgi:hypothetical protein